MINSSIVKDGQKEDIKKVLRKIFESVE